MLQNLTGWHALIILAIVVLVFGAAKLPALAKSVGQSMRILRSEVAEPSNEARVEPTPSGRDRVDARESADLPQPVLRPAE
ncbi:twin-arginine translocase TatA/TatE family subunit [Microbacterium sp. LMC-P-041]|uniref:twin-arginine translocase TatA/TatE family subunit n=1 Tax=unclassified Microbacterium TaxID=2609290 RepID=UPI002555C5A9|nr:twin-arginine translocase TatA/TatE family subunit [Microbacterium sp. LMC-P-041]